MQKLIKSIWLGPLFSGMLTFLAVCQFNLFTSWFCYVPLFISISSASNKITFIKGIVFGAMFSTLAFFWMIPGAERFTGYNVLYGIGIFLVSSVFYSLFCAAVLWCIAALQTTDFTIRAIIANSILAASVFCIAETILRLVSTGLPWFDFHSGNALTENLYTIQPASFFGIHILTFVGVMVNYLIAMLCLKRYWNKLYIPVAIVVAYFFCGFLVLKSFEDRLFGNKHFNVAILSENISPDIKWDDNTGNMLVKKILYLNHLAVAQKPDIALWSESAIPWTYSKDDDLVKEVLHITDTAGITHLMGINTAFKDNEIFNSVYCILPGGTVTGRYDKQYLLSFIEKPVNGLHIPFFSSKGFFARNDITHGVPLATAFGKAGFLICNEAALPAAAANQVKQGAGFLMNLSNDGWFSDTYIVKAHFNYARLRAVETRKDLAINCNNGYSGLIEASGVVVEQEKSEDPFLKVVSMQPNNIVPLAASYPDLFAYGCAVYLLLFMLYRLTASYRRRKGNAVTRSKN